LTEEEWGVGLGDDKVLDLVNPPSVEYLERLFCLCWF
jgi:hypothetical protein